MEAYCTYCSEPCGIRREASTDRDDYVSDCCGEAVMDEEGFRYAMADLAAECRRRKESHA